MVATSNPAFLVPIAQMGSVCASVEATGSGRKGKSRAADNGNGRAANGSAGDQIHVDGEGNGRWPWPIHPHTQVWSSDPQEHNGIGQKRFAYGNC